LSAFTPRSLADLDAFPAYTILMDAREQSTMYRRRSDGRWDMHYARSERDRIMIATGHQRGIDEGFSSAGVISRCRGRFANTEESDRLAVVVAVPLGLDCNGGETWRLDTIGGVKGDPVNVAVFGGEADMIARYAVAVGLPVPGVFAP
jgi:hypothetical protein